MNVTQVKEMADSHWFGYVGPLVATHNTQTAYTTDEVYEMCKYHYLTAFVHGFKHRDEMTEEATNQREEPQAAELATSIQRYSPAHPYLHKSELTREEAKELADAVAPPSLCVDCIRQCAMRDDSNHVRKCGLRLTKAEGQSPTVSAPWPFTPPADEWAGKDLCRRCDYPACPSAGEKSQTAKCDTYANRTKQPHLACTQEDPPLSLALPTITVPGDLEAVRKKYQEELNEWQTAERGSLAEIIEAIDVIQVRQSIVERGGDVSRLADNAWNWLERRHKEEPEWVDAGKRAVLVKNAARFYYSDEVNSKIIMSAGREW